MDFLDRIDELARLDALATSPEGGLAVLYGRRRIGKTRLLLEWAGRHGGLYTVADQSIAEVQRRYFAEAVAGRLAGFADVDYPDWRSLLQRLAREARAVGWRGPILFDELPYLAVAAPELPSVLQRWLDHEAREAKLIVAVAGSSQRMMQGLVLAGHAPLFGRAAVMLDVGPIPPGYLAQVFGELGNAERVETWTAWGGIPRYWELASALEGPVRERIEHLVLDPMGPLHLEPDRMLIEEVPSALEVRPVLDAIGSGAHRVSEIAGRLGRPATSMSRPLERLIGMGLVRREVPFGELAKQSRRSLYKIDDPFFRLWFRVVAPYRAQLASGLRASRLQLLDRFWPELAAQGWEDLCRKRLPFVDPASPVGELGLWGPASRWWQGAMAEWDVVAESFDGERLLLGEVKWSGQPFNRAALTRAARETLAKPAPVLGSKYDQHQPVRVLFVPEVEKGATVDGVLVCTMEELTGVLEG